MMELKQFKLSNGEEIICEVIEWPDPDEDTADIVIRNVLKIVGVNQPTGNRYYSFTPWMVFQDDPDNLQMLNNNHILGEANPNEKLIEQYFIAIKGETTDESETAKEEIRKQLAEYISKLKQIVTGNIEGSPDSDTQGNIVKFPGRTVH